MVSDVFDKEENRMDLIRDMLKTLTKRESKLDSVRIECKNLTNDKEKRRYCDELEGVIQDLEDELDLKNKEIDKLDKILPEESDVTPYPKS